MTAPLDALAFGPHPDDVELCCGGTLALLADRGWRIGVVDLTRGELATHGTPELRAAEAARASAILGLAHRENLGLPDGFLTPDGGYADAPASAGAHTQVGRLAEALRRLRPRLVLAPWRHARHPDHEATHALVTRACFFAGVGGFVTDPSATPYRPQHLWFYPMRVDVRPSVVVDVSATHARKMDAIRCYASQLQRPADAAPSGPAATLVNDPRNLRVVEARDRTWGGHLGVDHGEAFVTRATPGVTDPLAFLRDHPFDAPLLFPPEPA